MKKLLAASAFAVLLALPTAQAQSAPPAPGITVDVSAAKMMTRHERMQHRKMMRHKKMMHHKRMMRKKRMMRNM